MLQYKQKVAIATIFAYFIDLMNTYMSTVAFPKMGLALHANASQLSWVVTAYVLSLTLIIPVSGYLGDKYGTKKLFLGSIFIFTVASYLCGFSSSIESLILWRFVQGLGGGLLIPVGQTMLFRQYPAEERAKISAAVLIPAIVAPMIAPTVGGFIAQYLDWSWIFYFNVPFGIVIFLLASLWLKEEKQPVQGKIDYLGLTLLSLGLFLLLYGCFLFGTPQGIETGLFSCLGSVALLVLFVLNSSRKKNPILNLKLLKNKTFSVGTSIYFLLSVSFSALNILMIYFFQNALGASPEKTGMLMIPFGIGSIIGLKIAGAYFHKLGAKKLIYIGLSFFLLFGLLFCTINNIDQYNFVFILFLFYGLSVGKLANSLQALSFLKIQNQNMSSASALFNLNRQLGLSLGVGFFSMILSVLLQRNHILNDQQLLHNLGGIHIFHLCFFAIHIITVFSFIALVKLNKKHVQLTV